MIVFARNALLVSLSSALSACVSTEADGTTVSYLGFGGGVSVEIPEPGATDLTATDLSLFGIWLERRPSEGLVGGGIGYRDRRSVVAPPECRIVIFAETDAQLAQAEAMARDLTADGEGICVSGL